MRGGDQAEVVDPGGVRVGAGGLRDGAVHVAAGDERGRGPGGLAVQEHLDAGQVLRVVPQLDPPPGQRGIDGVGVSLQRDGGGAGDPAGDRPAERLPQPVRAGLAGRPGGLEPADRGLPGLGVHPAVGDLPGPRGEQVVQLVQRLDALVGGFGQERLPDIAVEPLLLPPPFRRVGFRMHQPDAQHAAGTGQPRVRKRRSVISIEHVGEAAAGDRAAQQVLAGAGVLVREEPAIDQQPGMIIDDEEQPRPRRALPPRVRHPRADQHVGDPPLVRPGRLVPAVGLRLGGQRRAVQPGAAQLAADGPLGDRDPVPVIQDRGDLRGGPAGQLQPQRGGLGEQLRVRADHAGIGPRRRLQRVQPARAPRPQPPVDRAPRVAAGRPVRVRVRARGDLAGQRSPLGRRQLRPGRLGDHRPAVQCDLFLTLVIHGVPPFMAVPRGQEA